MEMRVPFTTFERSYHFQAIHGHIFKFWRVKSQSLGGERTRVKWKTFFTQWKGRNSCPWLLIDRVKWLCACVMCWPHRVGVSVCHLAFIATYLDILSNCLTWTPETFKWLQLTAFEPMKDNCSNYLGICEDHFPFRLSPALLIHTFISSCPFTGASEPNKWTCYLLSGFIA